MRTAFLVLCLCAGLSPSAEYKWLETSQPAQWALFEGDEQIGIFIEGEGYKALTPDGFGPFSKPPCCSPTCKCGESDGKCCCNGKCGACQCDKCCCSCREEGAPAVVDEAPSGKDLFGVERDKIDKGEITFNGRYITREEAADLITQGLPDDRTKLRLTVAGAHPSRQKVLNDLKNAPELAEWREKLVVQDYDPSAWEVAGVGLPAHGSPSIILQTPPDKDGKGRVLHAQHDYEDGAKGLAVALRKADPKYDHTKDPDLRKEPEPGPHIGPACILGEWLRANWLVVALAAVGIYFFVNKKESK